MSLLDRPSSISDDVSTNADSPSSPTSLLARFSSLVDTRSLRNYVEGERWDYSESIPTNRYEELYEYGEEDKPSYFAFARKREAILQEIIDDYGGERGLSMGRVWFGDRWARVFFLASRLRADGWTTFCPCFLLQRLARQISRSRTWIYRSGDYP